MAPAAVRSPSTRRMMSLGKTPLGRVPFTTTLMAEGTRIHSCPLPMIEAISVYPTPVAKAPTAP